MSALVWAFFLLLGVAAGESLGLQTSVEEYPFVTQVEFFLDSVWLQQCAATILTNRHVLTAASCFDGAHIAVRRIRAGSSTRGVGGQVVYIESTVIHDNYGSGGLFTYEADIAVIRLAEYLIRGETVQQAPILGQGIELPLGLELQHAGWGTTAEGGKESSEGLFAVNLTVHDYEDCMIKYISDYYISETMICAGLSYTRGRDFDLVDRGGFLLYQDTVVGVLTFGKADSDDEYPVVATSIGAYTSWIIENAV